MLLTTLAQALKVPPDGRIWAKEVKDFIPGEKVSGFNYIGEFVAYDDPLPDRLTLFLVGINQRKKFTVQMVTCDEKGQVTPVSHQSGSLNWPEEFCDIVMPMKPTTINSQNIVNQLANRLADLGEWPDSPDYGQLVSYTVDLLGLQELTDLHPDIGKRLPRLQGQEVSTYVQTALNCLSPEDRGAVLELGMIKAARLGQIYETGCYTRAWLAYQSGEWVYAPSCPDSFRSWLRNILDDGSASEATQLANVIEAVDFLREHKPHLVPDDPVVIFQRPHYRRWRAVAGKILARRQQLRETPETSSQEIWGEVEEIVDAVNDPTITSHELDLLGRQRPRVAPIVVIESPPAVGQTDLYHLQMWVTPTQRTVLLQRMKGLIEYRLQGEQIIPRKLAQYLRRDGRWQRRFWEGGDWQAWEACSEPDGELASVLYEDEEWQLLTYWV